MIRFSNKTYCNFIKFMQLEAQELFKWHKKPIILRSALARQSVRGRSTFTTQSCRENRMAQRKTPHIEIWQLYGAGHYLTKPLIFWVLEDPDCNYKDYYELSLKHLGCHLGAVWECINRSCSQNVVVAYLSAYRGLVHLGPSCSPQCSMSSMFMEELWLLLIIAGLVTSAAPSPSQHSGKLPVVRSPVSHHHRQILGKTFCTSVRIKTHTQILINFNSQSSPLNCNIPSAFRFSNTETSIIYLSHG